MTTRQRTRPSRGQGAPALIAAILSSMLPACGSEKTDIADCSDAADCSGGSGGTGRTGNGTSSAGTTGTGGEASGGGAGEETTSSGGSAGASGGASSNGAGGGNAAGGSQGGTGDGAMGDPCEEHADCESGLCINSLIPGPGKYCSGTCEVDSDCSALQAASYVYDVTDVGPAVNDWNSDYLWRGRSCLSGVGELVGAPTDEAICLYPCPDASALVLGEDNMLEGCQCLPSFRGTSSEVLACEFDPEIECSALVGCTKENTNVAECSAGNFSCVLHEGLEGLCFDFVSGEEIEACVADCNWDCDPACVTSCADITDPACQAACCTSENPACE